MHLMLIGGHMKKQLEIKIFPDGRIEANTVGITGKSCADYRALLETLLEARTTHLEYTDDYYLPESHTETAVQEVITI